MSLFANICLDEATGCWNWTGHLANGRYGEMRYAGEDQLVHRVSAHLYLGYDFDSPLRVLHSCDNTRCFNPRHLFIGTQVQNMQDMVQKGRSRLKEPTCMKGHSLSGTNVVWYYDRGYRHRRCLACHRERQREYLERKNGNA
jgi:hypothetical protein